MAQIDWEFELEALKFKLGALEDIASHFGRWLEEIGISGLASSASVVPLSRSSRMGSVDHSYSVVISTTSTMNYKDLNRAVCALWLKTFLGIRTEERSLVDQCLLLQYQCEILELTVLKHVSNLVPLLDSKFKFAYGYSKPNWFNNHLFNDRILGVHEPRFRPTNVFRCHVSTCIYYVYGFLNFNELENHRREHYAQPVDAAIGEQSESMGVDGEVTLNMRTKTKLGEEPEFIFCNDDSIKTNQGMRRPARARRGRPTEEEKQNKKKVKEVGGPCLRCRILKKRCDEGDPCHHCPQQDPHAESDHWKVLGCQRNGLAEFVNIFIPDFLPETRRQLVLNGRLVTVNTVESYDFDRFSECMAFMKRSSPEFRSVSDKCWECPETRRFLAELAQTADTDLGYDLDNEEQASVHGYELSAQYTAPWSIFMLVGYHRQIFARTVYNPITLFRIVYRMAELKLRHWDIGATAMSTIGYSAILYRNEQRLRARINDENMTENLEVDVCATYLRDTLDELFSGLHQMASRRASLTAEDWMVFFCSLCLLSITRSTLLDTCALQNAYKGSLPNCVEANRMSSAYKALVILFNWATPCDYLLEDRSRKWGDLPSPLPELDDLYCQIQKMVHQREWEARGIRSSKKFLLSLDSGFSKEGLYNGFLVQMYRSDEKTKE